MIRLAYLPANAAWVFLFGPAEAPLHTLTPISMGDAPRLHARRKDAVWEAERMGFSVARDGALSQRIAGKRVPY